MGEHRACMSHHKSAIFKVGIKFLRSGMGQLPVFERLVANLFVRLRPHQRSRRPVCDDRRKLSMLLTFEPEKIHNKKN